MNKKVSIIVPIYKVESYLDRCVNSLIDQTYTNLEIILVDDGSPDKCGDMCDKYAKKDARIKAFHKENGGLSDARNYGLKHSSGEYILFVDSDDYVEPKMVEILVKTLEKTKADISMCGIIVADDESFYYHDWYYEDTVLDQSSAILALLENQKITSHAWNKLYKRNIIEKFLWPKDKLFEDVRIMHDVFLSCNKIAISKEYLYYYYQRDNSICGEKNIDNDCELIEAFIERYNKMKNINSQYEYLCYYWVYFYTKEFLLNNKLSKKEEQKYISKYKSYLKFLKDNKTKVIKEKISKRDNIYLSFILTFKTKSYKFYKMLKSIANIKFNKKIINSLRSSHKDTKEINSEKFKGKMKKIILMGEPEYNNLGDHAIAYATKKFVEDNFKNYDYVGVTEKEIINNIDNLKKLIKSDDILLLQGGGNMGDIYPDQVVIRKKVIENFKDNKIIVMPQTIYSNDKNYVLPSYYFEHKNLTIFAREKVSFEMLQNLHFKNVFLVPDIVLYLLKYNKELQAKNKNGVILCLRDDKEKKEIDLNINYFKKFLKKNNILYSELSTVTPYDIPLDKRENELFNLFHQISSSKLIITDRLHGMIIAAITKTPCIVLPTFNHKVINSYKWLKELNYVKLCESKKEFQKIFFDLYHIVPDIIIDMEKNYNDLKNKIGGE